MCRYIRLKSYNHHDHHHWCAACHRLHTSISHCLSQINHLLLAYSCMCLNVCECESEFFADKVLYPVRPFGSALFYLCTLVLFYSMNCLFGIFLLIFFCNNGARKTRIRSSFDGSFVCRSNLARFGSAYVVRVTRCLNFIVTVSAIQQTKKCVVY